MARQPATPGARKAPARRGGRRERYLTGKELAELRAGLDTSNADGLRQLCDRTLDLIYVGKLAPSRARAAATLVNAARSLVTEGAIERRVERIEAAAAVIKRARQPNPAALRDVGPPPDGMESLRDGEEKN